MAEWGKIMNTNEYQVATYRASKVGSMKTYKGMIVYRLNAKTVGREVLGTHRTTKEDARLDAQNEIYYRMGLYEKIVA